MVKNQWQYLEDEDGEFYWFYFQNTGKAKDDGFLTVDQHKYHFTDGKMDEGWLQDDDDTYYLNSEHDGTYGSVKTGWVYIDDFDDDDDVNADEEGWYYFGTNGKMVTNEEKKINNAYYVFDENGLMLDNWVEFTEGSTATSSDASSDTSIYKYYKAGNGARVDGWLYLDDMGEEDEGRETEEGWYYFKKGIPYSASYKTTEIADNYGVAKINSKVYCFDDLGKMVTGKVEGSDDNWFYFDPDSGAMKEDRPILDAPQRHLRLGVPFVKTFHPVQVPVVVVCLANIDGLAGQLVFFHCFCSFLLESPFPGNTWLVSALASWSRASARLSDQPIYCPAGPWMDMRPTAG